VTDGPTLVQAVRGKSVVYHLAGCVCTARSADFYRVNEMGTRNLLTACSQIDSPPVVVVVSSLAAAGPSLPHRPRIESDAPAPVSHYGRSKLAAESAARELAHAVPITVVRPPIVLGEGDRYGLAIFKTVARLGLHFVAGRVPHRYSVIHVRELVDALLLAAERGSRLAARDARRPETESDGLYFVAGDERLTYAELGRMIGEAVGRTRTRVVRVPLRILRAMVCGIHVGMWIRGKAQYLNLDKFREIAAGSWTCSAQKARTELGFRPAAPLAERLRQTAAWYRSVGWL
jgi:nucleoside-diphosphate-sugar epimerase